MTNLTRIATQQERLMLAAFNEALGRVREQAVLQEIANALNSGNVNAAVDLLGLDAATFEPIEHALTEAYRTGGLTGAGQIGRIPTPTGSLVMRFNLRDPAAERWLSTNSSRLITEVVADQVAMARQVMTAGLEAGRNPRNVALDMIGRIDPRTGNRVGGFIGTTSKQAEWITNARAELERLDPNYFTRKLRDRRFDGAIEHAIADGKPLTQQQIDRAITQMQARTQRYRGETIARTESIDALRAGQRESIRQAVEVGEIDPRDAKKSWDSSGEDGRTRETHLQAEIDYKDGIPIDQMFIVGGEAMIGPGDSSASAENRVNCRCRERTTLDFGGQLRRVEGFR
jgi:hypothetical protein